LSRPYLPGRARLVESLRALDPRRRAMADDDDRQMDDRQMDGSLMSTLFEAYPAPLTVEEIQRALFESKDWQIADSLGRLEGAGMIHRFDPFVLPTRTAYHAGRLEYAS
jgi:hypothetical protein